MYQMREYIVRGYKDINTWLVDCITPSVLSSIKLKDGMLHIGEHGIMIIY